MHCLCLWCFCSFTNFTPSHAKGKPNIAITKLISLSLSIPIDIVPGCIETCFFEPKQSCSSCFVFSSSKSSWGTNIPRFGEQETVIQSNQKKMMNSPLMFETMFWRIYANKGWLTFNSKLKPVLSFDGFSFLVRIPSSYPLKFSSATLPKICVYLWAHIYRAPPLLLLVAPDHVQTSTHRDHEAKLQVPLVCPKLQTLNSLVVLESVGSWRHPMLAFLIFLRWKVVGQSR